MKLCVYLAVIGLASVFSAPRSYDPTQHANEVGPFNGLRRLAAVNNDARSGSGDSQEAIMCATQCFEQMAQRLQREIRSVVGAGQSMEEFARYGRAALDTVCSTTQESNTCMRSCEPSSVKTVHEKMSALVNDMCTSSFKNHAQCMYEVLWETNATCNAPSKCGTFVTAMEEFKQNPMTTDKNEVLKQVCLGANCKLSCTKEQMVRKCGEDAQRSMHRVWLKGVDFTADTFKLMGWVQNVPLQCNTVGAS